MGKEIQLINNEKGFIEVNVGDGLFLIVVAQLVWVIKKVTRQNSFLDELKRRCPLFKEDTDMQERR